MSRTRPVQPVPREEHSFSRVPAARIPRSSFDLSRRHSTAFDAGYLTPVLLEEVYPGDTFHIRHSVLARLSTPLKPLMDDLFLDLHYWFVPNRLVWDNWVRFMGEQDNPSDSINYTIPQLVSSTGGYAVSSLFDYFGLPVTWSGGVGTITHSVLPLRAYNLTWNTWYRDQNLQNSVTVRKTDSGDVVGDYTLLRRGKRHDYFTGALPWPLKGGSGVTIPITGGVTISGNITGPNANYDGLQILDAGGGGSLSGIRYSSASANAPVLANYAPTSVGRIVPRIPTNDMTFSSSGLSGTLNAVSIAISAMRDGFTAQQFLEQAARGGTRYPELIKSMFGVTNPDARMQRPEFLGGDSLSVNVFSVPQSGGTGASGTTTPQGNLAAFGQASAAQVHGVLHSFTEHGYVFCLASARARYTYAQGLRRMWSRVTRFDHYFPVFANLGEQGILNKEIYAVGDAAGTNNQVFGYIERWAELRYGVNQVSGLMRPQVASSIAIWNLAQNYASLPALNATFIVEDPPIDRVIATPTEPHFIADFQFHFNAVRALPIFSVPGLDRL